MNPNSKRKGKPVPTQRPNMARPKGPTDKSITTEGIYCNARFLQATTALMGCIMRIEVKNGDTYEGIFRTYSPNFEIVLEMVHKIDRNNPDALPTKECITQKYIFKPQDVITMDVVNVDLEYATKDSFATDSAISNKLNGKVFERELEPWDDTQGEDEDSLATVNSEDANGWDANEMFKTNKDKYGVTSTYDSSLAGYTVPLAKQDTEEYRSKEEKAKKIANEIEGSQGYKHRQELENGDEEDMFSAVVRPDNDNAPSLKYISANKKKPINKGYPRPQPPLQMHTNSSNLGPGRTSSGPQRTASPAHQPRNQMPPQPPIVNQIPRTTKPPYCPPPSQPPNGNHESKMSPNEPRSNVIDKKTPGSSPDNKNSMLPKQALVEKVKMPEKTSPNPHKPSKSEEIAGLKKFSNDFDIESKKTDVVSNDTQAAPSKLDKNTEAEDKLAATVKNSNLNPNAKEFVFNPNVRPFTPRSPQTPTPPTRPQSTQSPIIPHVAHPFNPHQMIAHQMIPGQQTVFTSMAAAVPGTPQPYMVTTPTPANVSITPASFNPVLTANIPQGPRYRKVHVAAATGQPLLAPAAAAAASMPSGPTKFAVQYPPPQGMVSGTPQPAAVMSYSAHPVYSVMGPRMFNPQTVTMVPTSLAVSAINYDQHGHNSQMYCATSLPGHQTPTGGQPTMVAPHGIVNHSTPPIQTQATTPGTGVHPSPSPVHHHSNNQPTNMPPQSIVFAHSQQMTAPPPPQPHQMQPNAQNPPGNGHQQGGNPSHMHLTHGNAVMQHGNQHAVTFPSSPATGQHMVLLHQGSAAGTHPQPVIHTSSTRTLQQTNHMHGHSNQGPGVGANTVMPHPPNQISVLQAQSSNQLHYIPQQPSQPAPVYHTN